MKKALFCIMFALGAVIALAIPAFANTAGTDVTDIMSTGMNSMKDDVLKIIAIALPIALAIFALFFGVRKGIAMLRGVAKG
jgi:hypothetical protein